MSFEIVRTGMSKAILYQFRNGRKIAHAQRKCQEYSNEFS